MPESTFVDIVKNAYIDYMPHPNVQVRPMIRAALQGGFGQPGLYC